MVGVDLAEICTTYLKHGMIFQRTAKGLGRNTDEENISKFCSLV
jgi:hypothetical protein